jgi:hypothetical protein
LWTGLLLHLRNVNTKRFYIGIAIVTGQRIQLLLCGGIKRHTVTPRLVGPLCLSNSYTQPPVGSRVGAYQTLPFPLFSPPLSGRSFLLSPLAHRIWVL